MRSVELGNRVVKYALLSLSITLRESGLVAMLITK